MDHADLVVVAEALAIGLLIGAERYRDRAPGEIGSAGIRTFGAIALLGALAAILNQLHVSLAIFASLSILLALGYSRSPKKSLGLTTELAALATFWLSYLVRDHALLAVSTSIVLAILLATKKLLHSFLKQQVSDLELHDTLKFLAVVFVVYPLLPDRHVGTFEFLNPRSFWLLVILVSTLSFFGYVLSRVLGADRGLQIGALLGGAVSTTAATVSLAQRARSNPEMEASCGVAATMANAIQLPRLLLLAAVVSPKLAIEIALPLASMFAAGMLAARLLESREPFRAASPRHELPLDNPYAFWPALKFGLFLAFVLFLTTVSSTAFGDAGIVATSALTGFGDVSAIALSVAKLVANGQTSTQTAALSILVALGANASLKSLLAHLNGSRRFTRLLIGGLLFMLATGALVGGFSMS